jgi:aminopeptidase-like protein
MQALRVALNPLLPYGWTNWTGSNRKTTMTMTKDDRATLETSIRELFEQLYPICRSITGPGVRQTLDVLAEIHPIVVTEVPTGTRVYDWTVPREWSIREAWIKDASGRTIVDFKTHNLHVLNYSVPIEGRFTLEELRPHLYTAPQMPDAIPYRTSYYSDNWGFCLTDRQLQTLGDGPYDVRIDSTLAPGSLTLGEIVLPGEIEDEILISTHVCHPSLANDNLTGMALAIHLAQRISTMPRRHTWRFLFTPVTIGSITWLALNEDKARRIRHGLVITGVGDKSPFIYKRSRQGDASIDRAAARVLAGSGEPHALIDFYPYGYDERQFNTPGFDLPVGRFSRASHGDYPEYHTSADNLEFVSAASVIRALDIVETIATTVDRAKTYVSRNSKGEPQLGKHGLYRKVAGQTGQQTDELALLWVMSCADGRHSLSDMADKAGLPIERLRAAAERLEAHGLVEPG